MPTKSKSNQADTRLAFSVSEFSRLIGVNRISVWRMIRRGELETAKVGRRHMVPSRELKRLKLIE
jgi:excisionase family DNA binding protein